MIVLLLLAGLARAAPGDAGGLHPAAAVWADEAQLEVTVGRGEVTAVLRRADGGAAGQVRAALGALPGGSRATEHYSVALEVWDDGPESAAGLIAAAERLAAADGGWRPQPRSPAPTAWPVSLGAAALTLGLAALRLRRTPIQAQLRVPHVLPMLVQGALFAYWAAWWPLAGERIGSLVGQLLFALGLDAATSAWRRSSWTLGLSVVPIVLSMNLFLWFAPPLQFVAVAVAIGGKALLHRQGRHVFNPSAFALTTVGALALLVPDLQYDSLAHPMNVPPYMGELILLLAVLPQSRLDIAPTSLAAFVGLAFSGVLGPGASATRPATLLALALLVTDPATLPRRPGARVLFGLVYGVLARVSSVALGQVGLPDDLGKVAPVLVVNLMAPWLDQHTPAVGERWLTSSFRALHIALWLAFAGTGLALDKAEHFEAALHWTYGTPGVRSTADGVPTCALNPSWCRAFGVGPAPADGAQREP